MFRKILKSLEDPNHPLQGPNIWALKRIGLLLPKNKFGKFFYVLVHQYGTLFMLSQVAELYLVKSNLNNAITNLKNTVLGSTCILKAFTYMYWQKQWIELLDFVTEADKHERETQNKVTGKILDSYTKYCRKVTYYFWFLVTFTVVIMSLMPLIRYSSSTKLREQIRNGTEGFPHIYISYMPVDKNKFPGIVYTLIAQIAVGLYGVFNMGAYDTSVVVIMVFFGGQFEILQERCRVMLDSGDEEVDDKQALYNIRQVHSMHVRLTKYFKLFNTMLSPVMFFYVAVNSLMLCASAYQLTIAPSTTQKFQVAEFLFFGVTQLFMFCWHSNIVLEKSVAVAYGPYTAAWWAASVPLRKAVVLFQGQLRIPHQLTAGPFANLSLATFLGILKGSYSYYMLLRD